MILAFILLAFIITYILTPFIKRLNILDIPNKRKVHQVPTPKAGGLSIYISVIILSPIANWTIINLEHDYILFILLSSILLFVGLYDDIYEMSPKAKFLWQLLISTVTILFGFHLNITPYIYINFILTVIWIVGFVNAFNLIDGLDGLAIGVFIISLIGYIYLLGDQGWTFIIVILISSSFAFLKFNYNPAKIFLGDTGSLFLGYVLAFLTIIYTQKTPMSFNSLIADTILIGFILFIPIFDTALSIIRRKMNNRPLFRADRSHFYNILEDEFNLSTKKTVKIIYIVNFITVILAITIQNFDLYIQILSFILTFMIVIFLTKKLDLLKIDDTAELIKKEP